MPLHTRLLKIIALLYKMQQADTQALENELLEQRKTDWLTALSEKGIQYGCNAPPTAPRLEDLRELRELSREDARSIANTWNEAVERQIQRLFDANPRGNRNYYFKNLEEWSAQRDTWKKPQIELMNAQTTRAYAQDRFRQMNGLRGGRRFVFVGPPPREIHCVELFAAGLVEETFIKKNPVPVHVGCPHEWDEIILKRIPCSDIWLG